jgi:hypothetical protein
MFWNGNTATDGLPGCVKPTVSVSLSVTAGELENFRFILVHTHLRQSSFGILGY